LFTSIDCINPAVSFYCPTLCGKCIATKVCNPVLQCINGAKQDPSTCKCDCFPGYTGTLCESLICIGDPSKCSLFTASDCSNPTIAVYCPAMCVKCVMLTTTQNTTTACNTFTCLNGGNFEATKCACSCYPSYFGPQCENLDCSKEATVCSSLSASQCTLPSVFFYCPRLCNQCTTTTTSTSTTISVCQPKVCLNGLFDYSTCSCVCSSIGFSGAFCDVYNCALFPPDDGFCMMVECGSADANTFCPLKCLCGITATTSTLTTTTAMTTTTTTTLPTCVCLNGGTLDEDTCTCACVPTFKGTQCQFPVDPCTFDDDIYCGSIDCTTASMEWIYKCQLKCLCCGNLKCENLGKVVKVSNLCGCQCFDDNFYQSNSNCRYKPGQCLNTPKCIGFTLDQCVDELVAVTCPKLCSIC